MIISHNNFTTGGILFRGGGTPYVGGLIDLSGNYLAGQLIPFMKGLHSQVVDCSGYPEVIVYDCADIVLSRGQFYQVATAVAVLDCENVTVANVGGGACSTGIFLQDCDGCLVKDSLAIGCGTGIDVANCRNSSIIDCDLLDGNTGISLDGGYNATIEGNIISGNDNGIVVYSCSGLLVYGNVFNRNQQNAHYYWFASPFDRWDDGNGTGNSWSDYFGVGPYIVSIMSGWTVADHYPKSTLAWYATPMLFMIVVLLAVFLALFLSMTSAYIVSARRKGALAQVLTSRNNWLLIVSLVWLIALPFVLMIEFSDYIGTTVVLSSMSYAIWYDLGWVYASPTFFTLSGSNLYSPAFLLQILCILLPFALVAIAWNDKRTGQHRRLSSNPILWAAIVYTFFALLLRGTPYQMWFNPLAIPLPISSVLIFMTLRHVVLEESHPLKDEFRGTAGKGTRCPHCGASYVYSEEQVAADGTVECQNCAKRFQTGGVSESKRL